MPNKNKEKKIIQEEKEFLNCNTIKDEHKIVSQLDEVTKETELKASEIFDIMENILESISNISEENKLALKFLDNLKNKINEENNIKNKKEMLNLLDIEYEHLQKLNEIQTNIETTIFDGMNIMQYQDINRQRIERVINVIRTLVKYLNTLFEGNMHDNHRTTSATFLNGDKNNITTEEELEEILQEFKKL